MPLEKKTQPIPIDLNYIIDTVRKNWIVFIVSTFICLCLALIYSLSTVPSSEVSSSILIEGEKNGYSQEVSRFLEGFGAFVGEKNFKNELQILKSKTLIEEAITQQNFEVSYFNHTLFKDIELYGNSPFLVVFNQNYPQPIDVPIKIDIIDTTNFNISIKSDDVKLYNFGSKTFTQTLSKFKVKAHGIFGEDFTASNCNFRILLNKNYILKDFPSQKFVFVINSTKSIVNYYKNTLIVEPNDLESTVAVLKLKTKTPQKAIDFINNLTTVYLKNDLGKKVFLSSNTIEYIDKQLNTIKDSLQIAETNLQRYRTSNQVMDIASKSGRVYDNLKELQTEKASISIKLKYYQYISDYFQQNKTISDLIAPSSMGIDDPLLNNLIQELIGINAEKVGLIENNQEKSPYLRTLNIRIENLKNTINENIKFAINSTELSLRDIDSRFNQLNYEISKLPQTERELIGIERVFTLNDAIYTFLLQKRAEAHMAQASYLPDAKVIETADVVGSESPSSSRKMYIFVGLVLGFILPLIFFRLRDSLNNKILNRHDLENLVDIPLLGTVYKNNKKVELVTSVFPKSHIAESFRMIRSNLKFFLTLNKSSIVVITSSYSQEGKSFFSLNLSASLASSNSKTILLGFDLRKPKRYERLNINENEGISNFLSSQSSLNDIIQKTSIDNLDIIVSGPIPPNPSELVISEKTDELLNMLLVRYQYIIIDTPPIGILSDANYLMDKADLKIFVVRQNFTPRNEMLSLLNEMPHERRKNLSIVLNDVTLYKKNKYGYEYYES